jgi:putative ABC transport system substrate-binding protein
MNRRNLITLIGGAVAASPAVARAQQGERVRRIGVLIGVTDDEEGLARLEAFRRGLQALGWAEGRNVQLVIRFGATDPARIRAYATELVTLAPDVILANTNPAARALRDVTQTIPIVFAQLIDPVADGLVSNLAHPGGNLTGFTSFEYAMGGKWLEALKEISPSLTRVLVIVGGAPQNVVAGFSAVIEAAASQYRMQITRANVISSADIEGAIQAFTHEPNGGLILLPTPIATVHLELFIALCALHRLPAIYPYRYFVARSGLLAYGFDNLDLFRRAASYVDRILKGANAGELPVQNPTKYELVINLKTAKALGLTVPPTLLARADEVIE